VPHRNFYQNGGWKSYAKAIYHVTLIIVLHLMLLVLVGHNVRYFHTFTLLINHTASPKTLYHFVEKYSLETSQTSFVYEAMLPYSKMAARRQLQNGVEATALNFSYLYMFSSYEERKT